MTASGPGQRAVPANGWNTRLYWLWILYNAVAFVSVLTAGFLLALLGSDVLHLSLASGHVVVALLIATVGAVLFGGLNVLTGDGSIAEVYLTLIATTPLTGRALLWVLAPSALALHRQPEPA